MSSLLIFIFPDFKFVSNRDNWKYCKGVNYGCASQWNVIAIAVNYSNSLLLEKEI